jgi:hypothetical protein
MGGDRLSSPVSAQDCLIQFVAAVAALRPRQNDWAYSSVEDLVLRIGRWFRPAELPAGRERGPKRRCYANAIDHAELHSLVYVEGFALTRVGLTVEHAWGRAFCGRL